MEQVAAAPLAAWESFYVIVGSSAAALTGQQFVVIVLSAELNILGSGTTTRAFSTPTIVHFCAVLFISAVLSAPWPTLASADIALGACGVAGCAYAVTIVRQVRRQADYTLVLEDWVWHGALPLIAYATLLVDTIFLRRDPGFWLFLIGGIAILLLFVGIHNAWDSVVYIALQRRQRLEESGDES
jgi:hypothetical protein